MNEPITPDPNWRDSIQGIINMGLYIKRLKESSHSNDVVKLIQNDFGIQRSGVNRLIKIAEDEVLADPQYADRLPPKWGILHELRLLPKDILIEKIIADEVRFFTKYDVWKIRGIKCYPRKRPFIRELNAHKGGGGKVLVETGTTLLGHIRRGMAMEAAEKITAEEVAERLNIYVGTYRMTRTLIQLSERPELTETDKKLVLDLLDKIEKTRNVRAHYRQAKPIIEKVWGERFNAVKSSKGMQKRVDVFRGAVIILHDTCQRVFDLEVPYMSDLDVNKSIDDLVQSGKIIRKLAEKLRRSKDG